jgi:GDPmannose 4,6-dehydratase
MLQQEQPDDYVVATGESHSVREFCEIAFGMADLDWQEWVKVDPQFCRPAEVEDLRGDPTKAHRILKWQPTYDFKELIREMVLTDLELESK